MDRRLLILISTLLVQSLYAASIDVPSTNLNSDAPLNNLNGTPLDSLSNLTPEDAKVLAELQNLRLSGEKFQAEAMNFIQSLPNRLSDGFTQSHQLFKLMAQMFSNAVNKQVGPLVESLQAGGKYIGDNAKGLAMEGLRRGQDSINAGVSYLQGGAGSRIQTRDLASATPLEMPTKAMTAPLAASLKAAKPLTGQLPQLENPDQELDSDSEEYDEEEPFEWENESEVQRLGTRDDKPVTTVLSEQMNEVGTASTGVLKNVAQFGAGGIRGLLDALSTVLMTTSDVAGHARGALSGINKSGARAISSAIDTGGNLVSGALDKTGSVVESIRIGGGTAGAPAAKA